MFSQSSSALVQFVAVPLSEAEEDVALGPAPVNVQLVVEPTVVSGPLAGVMGPAVSDEKPFVHGDGAMIRGGGGGVIGDSDDRR